MLHFDALKIYSCRKNCEKRRNCLLKAISPFLTMFSTLYDTYHNVSYPIWHLVFNLNTLQNVVRNFFQFGPVSNFVVRYRVNPFPNKPWFLHVCSTSLLKTLWEKEKFLVTSNFSFSNSVFYPF